MKVMNGGRNLAAMREKESLFGMLVILQLQRFRSYNCLVVLNLSDLLHRGRNCVARALCEINPLSKQ